MALLGNYTQLNSNPGRAIGGFTNLIGNFKVTSLYSRYINEPDADISRASLPTGTQPPYSYIFAWKGGELSSTTMIGGTGSITANALSGKFMTADLAGLGELEGSMSLITSMAANLAGVGALTADMKLTIAMAANLAGIGDLAGAMALLIPLNAELAGTGTLTANLKGNADLAATIYVNSGAATTQELVAAIWNAIAADYNESGTMGQKLNGAGSAGDPWTTDLSAYNTADTAGLILKQAKSKASLSASLSA